MCDSTQLTVVLLGKTGHGKSSTGNALLFEKCNELNKDLFHASGDATSVTNKVSVFDDWIGGNGQDIIGTNLKVIDTPGLCDTGKMTETESLHTILRHFENVMKKVGHGGITCFLLVLKYGNRFTNEELSTLTTLQNIFSDKALMERVIIIFTHKDIFDGEKPGRGKPKQSWEKWVSSQTGHLGDILKICKNKSLAFNNNSVDAQVLYEQRKALFYLMQESNMINSKYTTEDFAACCKSRKMMLGDAFFKAISEEVEEKTRVLRTEKNEVSKVVQNEVEKMKNELTVPKLDSYIRFFKFVKKCQEDAEVIGGFLDKYPSFTQDRIRKLKDVQMIIEELKELVLTFQQQAKEVVEEQQRQYTKKKATEARLKREEKEAREAREAQEKKQNANVFGIFSSLVTGLGFTAALFATGGAALAAGAVGAVGAAGTTAAVAVLEGVQTQRYSNSEFYDENAVALKRQSREKALSDKLKKAEITAKTESNEREYSKADKFSVGDMVFLDVKDEQGNLKSVRGVTAGAVGRVVCINKEPHKKCTIIVDFENFPNFEALPEELSRRQGALLWKDY